MMCHLFSLDSVIEIEQETTGKGGGISERVICCHLILKSFVMESF